MSVPTLQVIGNLVGYPESIPIKKIMEKIFAYRNRVEHFNDRIFLVKGMTGSGKSSILPEAVYHELLDDDRSVICTQPRILTAVNLAKDIHDAKFFPDMSFENNLGYVTGTFTGGSKYGLIFATIGILLADLLKSSTGFINKYSCIIIDEAHERSLDLDLTIFLLKKYLKNNITHETPFIIFASATIDEKKFMEYFDLSKNNLFEVIGRTFPIKQIFLEKDSDNYINSICDTVNEIVTKNKIEDPENMKNDILVFLPGNEEMLALMEMLEKYNEVLVNSNRNPILLIKINRTEITSNSDNYKMLNLKKLVPFKIHDKLYTPDRRLIIAGSVAETGLTIDSLLYVIECGWNKCMELYYNQIKVLASKPNTMSRILQRNGRAGRKMPGIVYSMYTEETFNKFKKQQFSEVVLSDITRFMMYILNTTDVIEMPPTLSVLKAIEKLLILNFITPDLKVTEEGELYKKLKYFTPEGAKMLFQCGRYNIKPIFVINFISLIETSNMFSKFTKNIKLPYKINEFYDTLNKVFDEVGNNILNNEFLTKNKYNKKTILQWAITRENYIEDALSAGIVLFPDDKKREYISLQINNRIYLHYIIEDVNPNFLELSIKCFKFYILYKKNNIWKTLLGGTDVNYVNNYSDFSISYGLTFTQEKINNVTFLEGKIIPLYPIGINSVNILEYLPEDLKNFSMF